jgi:thioredoxin-like negative regulator of GroEL
MDGVDRRTFFIGLLLAVVVILAGSFVINRFIKSSDQGEKQPVRERMHQPHVASTAVPSSPFVTDVQTDAEAVLSLQAGDKPRVVLVHAEWCGHCRTMMASFVEAASDTRDIEWVRVLGSVAPSLVRRADLRGFPTIYGVDARGSVTQHAGGRDAASLRAFANGLARAEATPASLDEPAGDNVSSSINH